MVHIEKEVLKSQEMFEALQGYVRMKAEQKTEAHIVEQGIWDGLLKVGHALLEEYFAQQGNGDIGDWLGLLNGQQLPKKGLHKKRYVSVFGPLTIERTCYGQNKTEIAPLDAKLNLPESDHSYLLQKWSQSFAVHDAYGEAAVKIKRLLHLNLFVGTLERMNRHIAQSAPTFQETRSLPPPSIEESLVVAACDGTRVPICRDSSSNFKIACVGAVYTIAPFYRTPDDVIDEVTREQAHKRRPIPQEKHVQAHLLKGKEGTFSWVAQEVAARNPGGGKTVVCLCDGERGLWMAKKRFLRDAVEVVDIFHVMEKMWMAAHCFHKLGSSEAAVFVERRLRMLLEGKVVSVISGLRQMATKRQLKGRGKKIIGQVTNYFQYNKSRMQYGEYLEKGYPIGSGVAEGACRHLVKDRLNRTGMRWTIEGAQAMLDLRAFYLNNEWEPFWEYHMQYQHSLLYGQIAPLILERVIQTA